MSAPNIKTLIISACNGNAGIAIYSVNNTTLTKVNAPGLVDISQYLTLNLSGNILTITQRITGSSLMVFTCF